MFYESSTGVADNRRLSIFYSYFKIYCFFNGLNLFVFSVIIDKVVSKSITQLLIFPVSVSLGSSICSFLFPVDLIK